MRRIVCCAAIAAALRRYARALTRDAETADDLVHTVPATAVGDETRLALPIGRAQVDITGSTGVGVVRLEGWTDAGRRVFARSVEIVPGGGVSIDLPAGVRLLSLIPERTTVVAAVRVAQAGTGRGSGTVVLPVRELVRRSLVPNLAPGLPRG